MAVWISVTDAIKLTFVIAPCSIIMSIALLCNSSLLSKVGAHVHLKYPVQPLTRAHFVFPYLTK